jgi:photosystem II stability/assembly factor-like uncharacterized protein
MRNTILLISAKILIVHVSVLSQSVDTKKIFPDDASIRGLSVVSDLIAWAGASKGWIGRTTDGGDTWDTSRVKGFEAVDFRSIYAFDGQRAIIANAGSPANILLTTDGGQTWEPVYTNSHPDAFIDGVDFWSESEGLMYGDPIDGRMLLIKTSDGGKTWKEIPEMQRPAQKNGEASFAASGTGIRCVDGKVYIATGGSCSRIFFSTDKCQTWQILNPPILQGKPATGIFALAIPNAHTIVVVGGDFQQSELAVDHVFYSSDGGNKWAAPASATGGYRECVEMIAEEKLLAAGPGGVDVSEDLGRSWKVFSREEGLHVVRKARKGSAVFLAGAGGKVQKLVQ